MPEFVSQIVCETPIVRIRDVHCAACRGRHHGREECDPQSHLVFPYRGAFVRRIGSRALVADVNQVLFFNGTEGYRVDHPVDGGDDCLSVAFEPQWFDGLRNRAIVLTNGILRFSEPQQRVSPRAQMLLAKLRSEGGTDVTVAEELAAALLVEVLGGSCRSPRTLSAARRRLVERAKLLLQGEPVQRPSLGALAAELGTSPIYLTQTFSQIEGMPLYRYQTLLRLARALARLPNCEDLGALALDLGFSSHSQFTAAFMRTYRMTPSEFRRQARLASLKNRTARFGVGG